MRNVNDWQAAGDDGGITRSRPGLSKTWLIGIAGTLAAAAWLASRERQKARRYGDSDTERRNPMHFFIAGNFPHRRSIDRDGTHPLFERRQSVYDAY